MKTAISIPDSLFEAAERLAKRLGISRSELYQKAIASFVKKHDQQAVTERLNAVFEAEEEYGRLDDVLETLQNLSLPEDDW